MPSQSYDYDDYPSGGSGVNDGDKTHYTNWDSDKHTSWDEDRSTGEVSGTHTTDHSSGEVSSQDTDNRGNPE